MHKSDLGWPNQTYTHGCFYKQVTVYLTDQVKGKISGFNTVRYVILKRSRNSENTAILRITPCKFPITVCNKSWITFLFSQFQLCWWLFQFHCRWLVIVKIKKVSDDFLPTVIGNVQGINLNIVLLTEFLVRLTHLLYLSLTFHHE